MEATAVPRRAQTQALFAVAKRHPGMCVGGLIVGLMVAIAVLAPLIEPYPPNKAAPFDTLLSPSAAHLFGTDPSGFDGLSRVIAAARGDLIIAVSGTALAVSIGGSVGVSI